MLKVKTDEKNHILLSGRFDASQVDTAEQFFEKIDGSRTVDFSELEYISSAGLGVLLGTQKRLKESGHELILTGMNGHIRDIFKWAGFDMIFQIR